jgi:transitional endoplasmic reticulum ATPase
MRSETAPALSGEFPRPHLPIPHRSVYSTFVSHSTAPRLDTDLVLSTSIRSQHPSHTLTIIPVLKCRLLAFAAAGHAVAAPSPESPEHSWLLSNEDGELGVLQWFARYNYTYSGTEYILYTATWFNGGREGVQEMQYLLSPSGVSEAEVQALVSESSRFDKAPEPGPAIWVFDGYWQRSQELYAEVMKASWGDVILDDGLKKKIVQDVEGFFKSKEVYRRYEVPWKVCPPLSLPGKKKNCETVGSHSTGQRGIIFYGPPGNGKTISIKALMHTLSQFSPPVTLLYVRTLHGFYGDERSIKNIFSLARRQAPCLLVFEDLDALITTRSRSYFLNEVDGITSNDGVCMIASTNHVDKLDPGISKRPSRFDRKYLFPLPEMKERVEYCRYWR